MKDIVRAIRLLNPQQRRAEKARRRQADAALVAAGQAEAAQTANRLISNPKEWQLKPAEEPVNE